MSKSAFCSVAVACLLAACKPGTPSRYIQPGEMEDILYDYHIGQSMAQMEDGSIEQRNYDRTLNMAAVLKKHGVTKAEFDSSLVYYYTRAERFQQIYRRVAERLSEQALDLGASDGEVERYASFSMNGDTADIWSGNRTAVLMPFAPYSRQTFRQKADTTYHKGDSFMLNMLADFIYQSGTKDAVICLAARLENDSVISRVNHVSSGGINQIRINIDDSLAVKEVYGYFYLGNGRDESTTLKLLFLKNIQLIRFHKQTPKDVEKPISAPISHEEKLRESPSGKNEKIKGRLDL